MKPVRLLRYMFHGLDITLRLAIIVCNLEVSVLIIESQ